MNGTRRLEIDTLRGIACIMLVAYHVIGSTAQSGLRLDGGFYRDLNETLIYLRMPLFTFLSGLVYAYRPFSGGVKEYTIKKIRRLLVPMLTVGTLFVLMQMAIPGTNNSGVEPWYLIHIIPVGHYWFIESLFFVFLLVVLLEKAQVLDSPRTYFIVLIAAGYIYTLPLHSKILSFTGFIYLLPYFLIGMGVKRYNLVQGSSKTAVCWLLLPTVTIVFGLIYMQWIEPFGKRSPQGLLLGASACIAIYALNLRFKFIAWIGVFSYSIYLFHVFCTAGSRVVLTKLGIEQIEVLLICGVVLGLIGPIVAESIFSRSSITRVAFLGKSPRLKPRPVEAQPVG